MIDTKIKTHANNTAKENISLSLIISSGFIWLFSFLKTVIKKYKKIGVKKKMVLSEFPKNSFNNIVSDSFVGAGIQVATTPKSVESL